MSTVHRVLQGECLSSIAKEYGFANWKAIYDHPANAALKARRPNPNALVPGDRLVIPEPIPKTGKYALGAWHELRIKNQPTTLRVQLRDMLGKTFANAPYSFEIGNELRQGTTDGDGVLKEEVDPTLSQARVTLRPGNPDFPEEICWQLELGTLDDASTVSGAQGRLRNLGYYTGPVDGRLSEETRFALRAFQRENELEASGRLESSTVDKLQAIHDAVT